MDLIQTSKTVIYKQNFTIHKKGLQNSQTLNYISGTKTKTLKRCD